MTTRPTINSLFGRVIGEVLTQLFQVHPLIRLWLCALVIDTVNLWCKLVQLIHHPCHCLGQILKCNVLLCHVVHWFYCLIWVQNNMDFECWFYADRHHINNHHRNIIIIYKSYWLSECVMITVIIILFRLCGMSLVHHKAIIRYNRMCSYWSLWIYGVTSNHSIV